MARKKKNKLSLLNSSLVDNEPAEPKLDFDTWYALRKDMIPSQHHKEIIRADFYARGLDENETEKTFDAALAKYGVNL